MGLRLVTTSVRLLGMNVLGREPNSIGSGDASEPRLALPLLPEAARIEEKSCCSMTFRSLVIVPPRAFLILSRS